MGNARILGIALLLSAVLSGARAGETPPKIVFPGEHWETATPAESGLDESLLNTIRDYLGGRGCIIRRGRLVYSWGDYTSRGDVASAAKPWYSFLLFRAVEEGLLPSLDAKVETFEPRLRDINESLGFKDSDITFRHMANQTSCYGVTEKPGEAFDYNDWQMSLFVHALILKVYGASWATADEKVLHARLTDILQCEDAPTLLAFGEGNRNGRLAVSPRDFARFGLLFLRKGDWNGRQVLNRETIEMAVTDPLPPRFPRTKGVEAQMLPDQPSIGSQRIPDNQTDHFGSYSWLWWINGVDRDGRRRWPDAPIDAFAALGHANGQRGMAVIPGLDIVISWNDTTLGERPDDPPPLNEMFRLLGKAAKPEPLPGQIISDPADRSRLVRNSDENGDGVPDSFFMCGPGDPENFLYRGVLNPDGVRTGDQSAIIEKMKGTGANCLYFQAVRSHDGDGDASHNPFIGNDPARGLNEFVLNQWEMWFREMDRANITIFLFIYDDGARIWDTGDEVGAQERAFIETLVKRFSHHANLIWCVAEEYDETYTAQRVRRIASVIRGADAHSHPIAVHKLNGLAFDEFADDPCIGLFAVQYNVARPDQLHDGVLKARAAAKGRYGVIMSEAEDYGFGHSARRKNWACALGGAHAMALGWTFDSPDAPSLDDLKDCGRLIRFLESAGFGGMIPRDEMRAGAAQYVLASARGDYIVYAAAPDSPLGLKGMRPGMYSLLWFDPKSGAEVKVESVKIGDEHTAWESPFGRGNETVLLARPACR
ncbi:MAG TPA: serine hydrolase [Candidatus Brocadiia bacterium]|nr:serine hydrolase [Candidatus Brocadiia bacterium]